MSGEFIIARTRRHLSRLRERLFGQHITVYPTYAFRESEHTDTWLIPLRIWVHDNRDTPGVEEAIEYLATAYFERDLERPLSSDELTRLDQRLACFIADDKGGQAVALTMGSGEDGPPIALNTRTTPNGVIEETIRLPDELVREQGKEARWLTIRARTTDGHGFGEGRIQLLQPEGVSIVSDIDDTVKITHVPAGKGTVLRNVFLKPWRAAEGMRARFDQLAAEATAAHEDVSFHYVSGSPWQLYELLSEFLIDQERFPAGSFHLKNFRKNLFEPGSIESVRAFVIGGDLATLDQKIRQITNLMLHLPRRQFVLIGDSGEKDPEVYRAIDRLFPRQVRRILIRDVLGARLAGMERITGPDVPVTLDTTAVEKEMFALVAAARAQAPPAGPEVERALDA